MRLSSGIFNAFAKGPEADKIIFLALLISIFSPFLAEIKEFIPFATENISLIAGTLA